MILKTCVYLSRCILWRNLIDKCTRVRNSSRLVWTFARPAVNYDIVYIHNHSEIFSLHMLNCFLIYWWLEIPALRVFLCANAQLLWTNLAGARMPLSTVIKTLTNVQRSSFVFVYWVWILTSQSIYLAKTKLWPIWPSSAVKANCRLPIYKGFSNVILQWTLLYLCVESEFWLLKAFI